MENQPISSSSIISAVNAEPNIQASASQHSKTNLLVPILLVVLVCAAVFGSGGYFLGKMSQNSNLVQENDSILTAAPISTSTLTPTVTSAISSVPTASPKISTETTYTYNTFSITFPKTWQAYDSTINKDFFSKNNLNGFDHLVALQNDDNYLVIGIDDEKTGAEAGGIFASETDFQEYLNNHDEIMIDGDKFFLAKGDASLNALSDPDREAGIFSLASLSKYIPNKVTNEQKQTFNGYDYYMQTLNKSAYMIIKFSKNGNDITPFATQAEFKKVLETIHW